MKLTEYKIGNLIEEFTKTCDDPDLTPNDISGINREKEFFEPSKQVGADTSKYKIVPPDYFACNLMHVGRDKVLPISLNYTAHDKIVSPAYTVFRTTEKAPLLKEYFFLMMKSSERDRMFWFHTDSSIRDGMPLADFGNIKILLPPIETQKKYVAIYHAMQENQHAYEQGLDDLKLCCDAFIENLRKQFPCQQIGNYLEESMEKNTDLSVTLTQGVDVNLQFIPAKREAVNKETARIVRTGDFAFNKVIKSNGTKLPIALRYGPDCIVSSSYQVFRVKNSSVLFPEYLMLWLSRTETQRRCGFNAWGSTRDVFPFSELCKLEFPIPPISIQKNIVDIYNSYLARKQINEKLKQQLKDICPILIRGSLKEAKA